MILKKCFRKVARYLAKNERRKGLQNHSFSIISNSCVGGVISNLLGEEFRSPTVNLIIYQEDFITFCSHLKEYSKLPVDRPSDEELKNMPKVKYPLGIIHGGDLPDIKLLFVHYKDFETAKQKWETRFTRVNYDNLFILMDRGVDASDEILDEFEKLDFKNKVFFTHKIDEKRWKDNFSFSFYSPEKYFTNCLYQDYYKGLRQYKWLDEFDFVRWLNTGEKSARSL